MVEARNPMEGPEKGEANSSLDISTGHGGAGTGGPHYRGAGSMTRRYGVALASGARPTDKYASAPESARALSSHALAPACFATR